MTEKELTELARATQELRLKQQTPDPLEALRSVPILSPQDIPKGPIPVPTEVIFTLSFRFVCLCIKRVSLWVSSYNNCLSGVCRLRVSMELKY